MSAMTFVESSEVFTSDCFQSLEILSRYFYFIFLSPCKVVFEQGTNSIQFVSSFGRKVMFLVTQTALSIVLLHFTIESVGETISKISRNPTHIYNVVALVLWCLSIVLWPIIIFSKAKKLRVLCELSFSILRKNNRHLYPHRREKLIVVIVCGLCTILSLIEFVPKQAAHFVPTNNKEHWYKIPVPLPQNNPALKWTLLIVVKLLSYYVLLVSWVIYLPSMCSLIVLNGISEEFLCQAKMLSKAGAVDEIIASYASVTKLVGVLNEVLSTHNFLFMANSMTELCKSFNYLTGEVTTEVYSDDAKGWIVRITLITFMCLYTYCLSVGVTAHQKFQSAGKYFWKCSRAPNITHEQKFDLLFVKNDLYQNPLGARAYYFIVTYSVAFTAFGTTLTYIFILFQFQDVEK